MPARIVPVPRTTPRRLACHVLIAVVASMSGLAVASDDAAERSWSQDVAFLAHPALEGRLPGTRGIEVAEWMIRSTFRSIELVPAFGDGESGWEQRFEFRQGNRFGGRAEMAIAEGVNLAGVLPGVGQLADEWIVIGAHHDHLGLGAFGSRRGRGEVHEGADDNASGTAGVLLTARLLKEEAATADDDARRSILFITFSGEESGLNGARHFIENPPMPIESIALMINFDMIGRIENGTLSIAGANGGEGLPEFVLERASLSPLGVKMQKGLSSRSDHAEFHRREIPVLFFSESVFHEDYHTPDDEVWKIRVEPAVQAIRLASEIAMAAARRDARFAWRPIEGFATGEGGPSLSDIKVRFGIKPGNYGDVEPGIEVAGVSPNTSAERGGLREGDLMLRWNGVDLIGIREWMEMLATHEPGDIVEVTVIRDGRELVLPVMLYAKDGEPNAAPID